MAVALLGHEHPLVGALGRLETIGAQLVGVAVAQVAGLVLWWREAPLGPGIAAGALGVALVLACWMLVALERRSDACLDLIAAGREDLPLAAVAHEPRRLARARHRRYLARAIEQLALGEPTGAQPIGARRMVDRRVVDPLRLQIEELARRLRCDQDLSVRGVALVEQLISAPRSALYGPDPDRLRRELGRARYLLGS